ncbi:hypothetical protein SAMN05421846_10963 [Chryseobacterium taeanense]|uniref:Uncharacterized protein n=1 Tax=Chryseobacterium taeanense TaxID=311334 RepID=A0A1G8LDI2_9FLAO|nr:hypothetical protein [Chryseobacterium taeanense]SDI53686.1 hypothetical protein SAMN05421846_10963 [Chryseobacterium taeanense]
MVILGNAIAKPSYRKDATIIKNGNGQEIMYRYGFWSVQIKQINTLAIYELRI